MKFKNTLQKGSVRYIVFREGGVWYAVGLEFNIVESGDSPKEALLLLLDALRGYVESARKIKARPSVLNQKSDKEYEEMWRALESNREPESPGPVYTFGRQNLRSLVAA